MTRRRHGRKTRAATIIAAMDRVNRHRALTPEEVDRLWSAILQERRNALRRPHLHQPPREGVAQREGA